MKNTVSDEVGTKTQGLTNERHGLWCGGTNTMPQGLTNERHGLGRGGDLLCDEQHEHGEGQEDGEAQRHLLTGHGRQPEGQDVQRRQHDAGHDDVEEVEEGVALEVQDVGEVGVCPQVAQTLGPPGGGQGLVHGDGDQLPLAAVDVGGGVHRQPVRQRGVVQLALAVDPRPETQRTDLHGKQSLTSHQPTRDRPKPQRTDLQLIT